LPKKLYNVFIYEPYYEWLIIMYVFVYIIDFGNTSKTYHSGPSLNSSPMINLHVYRVWVQMYKKNA